MCAVAVLLRITHYVLVFYYEEDFKAKISPKRGYWGLRIYRYFSIRDADI